MNTIQIPQKLRLTFKTPELLHVDYASNPRVYTYDEHSLGFAKAYEPEKKSWENLKRTQDEWAYQGSGGYHYNSDGKVWKWYHEHLHENFDVSQPYDGQIDYIRGKPYVRRWQAEVPGNQQPRIIDNQPTTGFKIDKSVKRLTTSNKLWRVLDPRGFLLEISTENFCELLLDTTIDKGLIHGAYVWGFERRSLRLIPA